MPAAASPVSTTTGTAFEGLFVRTLQPTGRFADELRTAGFDVSQPIRAEYPTELWMACVDIARRHTYPTLPRHEGERRLGERFMGGYFQTLTGKLLGAALALLKPETVLQRLPTAWMKAIPRLRMTSEPVGERRWRLAMHGRNPQAEVCAGMVHDLLARVRVQPEVRVAERSDTHCVLDVTWR